MLFHINLWMNLPQDIQCPSFFPLASCKMNSLPDCVRLFDLKPGTQQYNININCCKRIAAVSTRCMANSCIDALTKGYCTDAIHQKHCTIYPLSKTLPNTRTLHKHPTPSYCTPGYRLLPREMYACSTHSYRVLFGSLCPEQRMRAAR